MSWLNENPLLAEDEYFRAIKIADESGEETLEKLFTDAISKLVDYSSYRIAESTALGVLPIAAADSVYRLNSDYFTEQLILSLNDKKTFRLTDRSGLEKVLDELSLQETGLTDESETKNIGKLIGADMLLSGSLFDKDKDYELFLKLLRVETGEILAITKIKIDHALGM